MSSTSSTSASLFTNAADGGLHRRARPVRQAAADASGRRRRGEAAVVVVVVAAGVVCVCGTGSRSSSSGRCCCAVVVPAGTSSSGRTRRRLRTSPCNRCSCCCCSCPGSRSCFLNSPSSPCSCCRRAAPHRRRAPTSDQALERRTDLSVQRHDPVDVGVDVPDQRAVAFEGLGGAFLVVAVDLAEEDSGFFFFFRPREGRKSGRVLSNALSLSLSLSPSYFPSLSNMANLTCSGRGAPARSRASAPRATRRAPRRRRPSLRRWPIGHGRRRRQWRRCRCLQRCSGPLLLLLLLLLLFPLLQRERETLSLASGAQRIAREEQRVRVVLSRSFER